jgi:hypothetical protein
VLAKTIFVNKYPYTPTSTDLKHTAEMMLQKPGKKSSAIGKYGEI